MARAWNIVQWDAAGRPMTLKQQISAGMLAGAICDPVSEQTFTREVQAQWLQVAPQCRAQLEATMGLPYDPGVGAFVAPGTQPTGPTVTISPLFRAPVMAAPDPARAVSTSSLATVGGLTPAVAPSSPTGVGPMIQPTEPTNMMTTSTRPRTGLPISPTTSAFDLGGAILGGIGGFVTGGPGGALVGALTGGGLGGQGSGGRDAGLNTFAAGCPTGFRRDPQTGQCLKEGISGAIERFLPGGKTGTAADIYGQASLGMFGVPAIAPAQLSQAVYRCPPGTVLGKDNLCYAKGSITNKQRKWPKGRKPLLTGGDMRVLSRARTLEGKVKRAAQSSGFIVRKRK